MNPILVPILLLALSAVTVAVGMLVVGSLLGPRRTSPAKEMPYESGMDPVHDARRRFDVRFHLVAIAFLVFDVELLFLYPWAVANRHPLGLVRVAAETPDPSHFRIGVFWGVMVFLTLLVLGVVYEWRKGVFRWR